MPTTLFIPSRITDAPIFVPNVQDGPASNG